MEHIRQILENLELHAGKVIKEGNLNLKCECRFSHIFTISSLGDWCSECNDTEFINKKKIDVNDNLYNLDFNFRLIDMDIYGICAFICRRSHIFTSDIDEIPDECEKCKLLLQDSKHYKIVENNDVFSVINSFDSNHSDSSVNFPRLTDEDNEQIEITHTSSIETNNSDNEEYYDSYYKINGSLDEVSHNSEDSYYRLYESDSEPKSNDFNDDFIDITENFLNDCDNYTLNNINLDHKELIEPPEKKVYECQPIEVISHTNNMYVNLDSIKEILLNKP